MYDPHLSAPDGGQIRTQDKWLAIKYIRAKGCGSGQKMTGSGSDSRGKSGSRSGTDPQQKPETGSNPQGKPPVRPIPT